MNLIRIDCLQSGIFGTLTSDDEEFSCFTLEHAYPDAINFTAKIPRGTYTCVRGQHQLQGGKPFSTFEVTNVPGHTNILFHPGNTEADSEGCILLGLTRLGDQEVLHSVGAFNLFMDYLEGIDTFQLIVL